MDSQAWIACKNIFLGGEVGWGEVDGAAWERIPARALNETVQFFVAKGGLDWGKAGWQSSLARAPDGHTYVPTLVP